MAAAARKHRDLVLRRVDVQSWKSPVARQFDVRSLPTFRLYDGEGKLVQQGTGVYKRVLNWKSAAASSAAKGAAKGVAEQPDRSGGGKGTGADGRKPAGGDRSPARREARIRLVSRRGERVDFERELVPEKFTLFEFYADWSEKCAKIEDRLQAAVMDNPDIVLNRIRVKSGASPVMRQHDVRSVPYFVLFDPSGELVKEGEDLFDDVMAWKQFKKSLRE